MLWEVRIQVLCMERPCDTLQIQSCLERLVAGHFVSVHGHGINPIV